MSTHSPHMTQDPEYDPVFPCITELHFPPSCITKLLKAACPASDPVFSRRRAFGPNFIELLSTNNYLLSMKFLVTGIQLLFAYPENQVEIWLVILFLSRKKFNAKQIFVLSSSMKLGPDLLIMIST